MGLVTACQSGLPKDALKLSPETLEKRDLQTRVFDGISENDLLAAAAGLLQDLGFNLDESESKLGLIVASKHRSAVNKAQVVGSVVWAIASSFLGSPSGIHYDKNQKLRVSLVVRPRSREDKNSHFVRVTFQRVVRDNEGDIVTRESIEEPKIYQEFFDKLSKSVFLEAQKV